MKKKIQIFTEILQNGEVVDQFTTSIKDKGAISLSNQASSRLEVPQYPFAKDIVFTKPAKGDQCKIVVPQDWKGFVTSLGVVYDITDKHASDKIFDVGLNDYGALQFRDLTFLYKVQLEKTSSQTKIKKDRRYSGQLAPLLIREKSEWPVISIGIAISTFIWGCFLAGLLNRPNDLPQTYSDLEAKYLLPFIDADHLETIPEAAQGQIDRQNYFKSTLTHYRAFTQMLLGQSIDGGASLYQNSIAYYRGLFNAQQDNVAQITSRQADQNEAIRQSGSEAVLQIPAVVGSSASEDSARVVSAIKIYHKSLKLNLNERRRLKYNFTNDKNYDMTLHGNIRPEKNKPAFGNISFTGSDDDETVMYKTASQFAKRARQARKYVDSRRDPRFNSEKSEARILLPENFSSTSFIAPETYRSSNIKLANMVSNPYGFKPKTIKKAKEPLTGVLDPALVSKTIDRRKFELQLCYELALRRNQKTLGKMEFSWRINSRGNISELKLLQSTIKDRRMVNCVRQKIASWKFPRPRKGSIKIKYPFSFKPRRG